MSSTVFYLLVESTTAGWRPERAPEGSALPERSEGDARGPQGAGREGHLGSQEGLHV